MEKKKILIVEDEEEMRTVLRMELETSNYEVSEAANGEEGLKLVKESSFDLIISDVLMPVMDGFSFYKELKKNKVTADIPVLILTARGKMEESFRVVGADEFIEKPFDSDDLLKKVHFLSHRPKLGSIPKTKKKVLVAGAYNDAIEYMVMQLKRQGCETASVSIGPDIISKAVVFLPDIIVIDVQMDGMPSEEIIHLIRQMPKLEMKPIVVYSFYPVTDLGSEDIRQKALSIDSSVSNCLQAGANKNIGRFNEHTFLQDLSEYF